MPLMLLVVLLLLSLALACQKATERRERAMASEDAMHRCVHVRRTVGVG